MNKIEKILKPLLIKNIKLKFLKIKIKNYLAK